MVIRILLALLAALTLLTRTAVAETGWPPEVKLALVPDPLPAGGPVLGEMLLATLHGEYVGNVALEQLSVPAFDGWSWMQLGAPTWSDERIDNRATKVFEVRFAFFPQRTGAQTIGSLTHRLTFAGASASRVTLEAVSAPVVVEVAAPPPPPAVPTGMRQPFWMPARAVRLTDGWDSAPDRLAAGDWARRTVTLEVAGLPPEALPPAPSMAAANLFTFVDGEERTVERTPEGPVSKVVWRYRMQPQTTVPADLDNIPVAWFDTGSRVWREEILRGAEIAFAGTTLAKTPGPAARLAVPFGLGLGVAVGALGLLSGLGLRRSPGLGRLRGRAALWRAALALRLAESRRDPVAARRALFALLRARGIDPAGSAALGRLDRRLFGPDGAATDLAGLTRQALRDGRPA